MDTKLKRSDNIALRVAAFALCVLFVVAAATMAVFGVERIEALQQNNNSKDEGYIETYPLTADLFSSKPYLETKTFKTVASNFENSLEEVYSLRKAVDEFTANPDESKFYLNMLKLIYSDMAMEITAAFGPGRDAAYSDGDPYSHWGNIYSSWQWDVSNGSNVDFDMDKMLDDARLVRTEQAYAAEGQSIQVKYPNKFDDDTAAAFSAIYADELKEVQELMLLYYETRIEEICKSFAYYGIDYFIGDGLVYVSNAELGADNYPADTAALTEADAYFSRVDNEEEGTIDFSRNLAENYSVPPGSIVLYPSIDSKKDVTIYLSFGDKVLAKLSEKVEVGRDAAKTFLLPAAFLLIAALILFILLIVLTGRKRSDGMRRIYALDNIFPEVQALFATIIGIFGIYSAANVYIAMERAGGALFNMPYFVLLLGIVLLTSLLILWLILSLVRQIKSGLIVKRSLLRILVCKPILSICLTIRHLVAGTNPYAKTVLLIVPMILASIFAGLIMRNYDFMAGLLIVMIVLAAAMFIAGKHVMRYEKLRKGVVEIANGSLEYKIPVLENASNEFDRLSLLVNEIGSASYSAIQSELKNQRLKTDLISNVSHDLRTPLTSIITYTDLLKTEGLNGKKAEEYLKVIDEKGRRLQKLTEDLFDAAKASSGAINFRKEKVDLLALVKQEIAEMQDGFDEANLDLLVDGNEEHYYVSADSQLLWRVTDNLLSNVRKYALPGSRVYIDIKELPSTGRGGAAFPLMTALEIKNVSAEKLNIPAGELMERFMRGDSARSTEGSGLGLAIAKDLTRLQGGNFEIVIDGDLFKTVTTFESYAEAEGSE